MLEKIYIVITGGGYLAKSFCYVVKTLVIYWISHSYLTGITTI